MTNDVSENAVAPGGPKHSQDLLPRIFESLSDAVLLIGPPHRGIVTVCNGAAKQLFGYSPHELVGRTTEILHVDEASFRKFGELGEPVLDRDGRFEIEYPMRRRDGTVFEALITVTVLDAAEGWGGGVVSVIRDVSRRKRAERESRLSDCRYRTVFETAGAAMAVVDQDGAISRVNGKFEVLSGCKRSEVEGKKTWTDFVAGEDLERLLAYRRRRLEGDHDVPDTYHAGMLDSAGRRHDVLVATALIPGSTTSVVSFLDVSEVRRVNATLRRFRTALDNAADSVFIIDPHSMRFIDVNTTACESLGYSMAELLQLGPQDIMPSLSRAKLTRQFKEFFSAEQSRRIETVHRRRDGSTFPVEVLFRGLKDTDGNLVVANARDISERVRMQKEKDALQAQARHAQRMDSIGTLAGGVAHEINNPINGIMNYAQLIRDHLRDEGNPVAAVGSGGASEIDAYAQEIMAETERIASLVSNLLQFARRDTTSLTPARPCDIVGSTLSLVGAVMRHDQIELTVGVPEELPQIRCRSQQIQQVLMNLVTNARDALNEKFPGYDENKHLCIRGETRTEGEKRWVRLTVEDRGRGIPDEVRERMYDPFYTTKPRDAGTGLGLSIVHGIVREHNGRVRVESSEGEYTRFHVDLPVV